MIERGIEQVNQMKKEEFISKVGWVFEHSPWIAEQAWERRPFPSGEALLQTMITIVQKAEASAQLQLLRAHPDLGTRLKITDASHKEQAGAGLDKLTKDEYEEMASLNQQYVNTFGFPFIMAVKGQSKEAIVSAMKERIHHPYEQECTRALQEVYKIAAFRLNETIR